MGGQQQPGGVGGVGHSSGPTPRRPRFIRHHGDAHQIASQSQWRRYVAHTHNSVSVGFSEPSDKVLQAAIEVGSHFDSELLLAHFVAPAAPGIPADPMLAFAGNETYEQAAKSAAEEQLAMVIKRIPSDLKTRSIVEFGDAAEEIVRLVKTEAADLVVISTHGLTGWRR